MTDAPRLMLLDTYGLVYRAFFALPGLTTSKGVPINAVYGFTMMLSKLIADEKPTHVIAAFDKGMPAERVALYKEYKAQRAAMPDELRPQFAMVRRVLSTYGIPVIEVDGQEADDVIATLARQAEDQGRQTLVVTGDLDLLQIVDRWTTVLTTRRGITDLGRYDPDAVRERFELDPKQLPDYRGLKGDPSDNLPGIPGVGEKTASKLIKAAGSLDNLLAHPELAGTPKLQKLVEEFGDQARVCRDVSVVRRDLDVTVDWESSRYSAPPNDSLYALYSEFEFKGLLARLDPPAEMPLFANVKRIEGSYRSYTAAVDPPEFARLAGDLRALSGSDRFAIALAGDALGVSGKGGTGVSLGLGALAHPAVREAFIALWTSEAALAAYDAKRVLHALGVWGIAVRAIADDAMIGLHLLDPSRTFGNAADAASAVLGVALDEDAAAHADATLQLVEHVRRELSARDQVRLYEEIEVPLAPVLAKMERAGIAMDPRELQTMSVEIGAAIARLQQQIYDFAGEEFNIGSPQQLGNILFGRLQIPSGKKNKTGWATGVEVLQSLAREYPICALVLEWREVTKLKNTYVDVIPTLIDADGRLRTVFNQTATATGRLSSTNPNLQNIPVRGELGRRIRKAFVARDADHVLLAADYSQIELRLMAHISGDEAMRRAFEEGQDIHDFTARQIFDVPPGGKADGNQRRMAKAVNFGLLYGMSDFGLAQRLEIGRAEAKEMSAAYFARFPSVRAFIENTLEEGRKNGFVSTIFGRRRYMPGLTSGNYMLRAAAEREATNAPLQGSAADLMKLAMVRIDRALAQAGIDAAMLLQIHDELIFEVPRAQLHDAAHLIRAEMEGAAQLAVPLEVTLKSGANWYDVEALDPH
jgi:DNA polymerase-1